MPVLLCALLYLLNMALDGVDGIVARRLRQVSAFGAILDVAVDNALRTAMWAAAMNSATWLTMSSVRLGTNSVGIGAVRLSLDSAGGAMLGLIGVRVLQAAAILIPCVEWFTFTCSHASTLGSGSGSGNGSASSSATRARSNDTTALVEGDGVATQEQEQGVGEGREHGNIGKGVEQGAGLKERSKERSNWKEVWGGKNDSPLLVSLVMRNGFKTPVGVVAIAGLHFLPLWFFVRHHLHLFRPDVAKTTPPPTCAIIPEPAAEAATLDADSPRAAAVARTVATAVETADRAALPSGAELAAQLQEQPAQQAQPPPLMKVPPESLTYPSGFLGGFGDNNPLPVDSKGHVAGDVAVDKDAYLRQILRSRVYDVAIESALEFAPKLSERIGNRVFLKREDTQPVGVLLQAAVFSFKLRGAYNMMAHLTQRQLAKGVICSSAGNHAQGVALSASRLHCSAIIAMPVTTPEIKWRAVQRLGAEVVLVGDSYDETQAYAKKRAEEEGRVFIPPFDHELVIAGQGTVGMEILRQWSTCDRTGGCGGGAGQWRFLDSSSEDEREGHGSNGSANGAVNGSAATAGAASALSSSSSSLSSLSAAAAASLLSSESPEQQQQLSQTADLAATSHSSPFFPPPPTPVNNLPSSLSAMLSQSALAAAAGEGEGLCHMDPSSLHAVFVPVGGGGLIAGIAAYIKALQPEVRVIGVEPADANAMALSLYHGRRVELSSCGTFADGVAVRQVGEETFRLCQQLVDGIVLVSRDEICAAIKDMFEDTRSILEPAGALALAGAKAYCRQYGLKGEGVVAVASGANMNFDRLRLVSELADLGARREAVLATTLPEIPGAFKQFAKLVGPGMSITEFKYRFCSTDAAHVLYSVGVHTEEDLEAMITRLEDGSMPTVDMTDNDLAKDHLRHLVGGRSSLPASQKQSPRSIIHCCLPPLKCCFLSFSPPNPPCSVGVHTEEDLVAMITRLEAGDMPTVDMTDNDLAKDHLRHLLPTLFPFPLRPLAVWECTQRKT
ncbi:unnamed protein product [Closterium sp. Naga37s-1]|nr:unnamed protein product [Closterium sp. Naga37s-1]